MQAFAASSSLPGQQVKRCCKTNTLQRCACAGERERLVAGTERGDLLIVEAGDLRQALPLEGAPAIDAILATPKVPHPRRAMHALTGPATHCPWLESLSSLTYAPACLPLCLLIRASLPAGQLQRTMSVLLVN